MTSKKNLIKMLENNGRLLYKVEHQTTEMCLAAVKNDCEAIAHVKNQTHEICLAAIKSGPTAIKYIEDQTEDLCLEAVNKWFRALLYIKNQTDKICLAAVKSDGWALQFVEKQNDEICLAAVRQNGDALKFVKKQNDEIRLAAVKNYGSALLDCYDISDKLILVGIKTFKFSSYLYRGHDDFFINARKEFRKKSSILNYFYLLKNNRDNLTEAISENPYKFCAEALSKESPEYVILLKDEVPDVFEDNDDLMAVYENKLISNNIEVNISGKSKVRVL